MKKIINGKVYDTKTAKEIGYFNDQPTGNQQETLYRKRTGEFFVQHWDIWNGDCINPISFKEAQKWLEDHGSAEQYAEVFGEPVENEKDVLLGIRVTAAAAAKLKLKASETGKTQSAILNELISRM